ncbi:WD repeat-containing protein 88-like [Bufo gargarizans]|uniref:WD repeat-containing protein 88-like n=1 Tax=Bufo gargarizans TaxID=30331 RepID=UPI001CF14F0C|nr:WD repeat-containing protein 88-like [Bufo gargarizans]
MPLQEKGSLQETKASDEETVWHSERLSQVPFRILKGHRGAVTSCHFCLEDTKIITGSYDGTAKLWDFSTCSPVCEFKDEHTGPVSECCPAGDNKRMVTSSYDKTVKLWDMQTGKVLWSVSLDGLVTSCNVSGDGKHVVCAVDVDNAICIIDCATASKVMYVKDHHTSTITRCCFDPESLRICSVSSDRSVKLWDVTAKRATIQIQQAHSNVISDCGFSANGRSLCTASWDKGLRIWDVNTGEFRHRGADNLLSAHTGSVSSCSFSQDASVLLSGGYDRTIVLWDVPSKCKKLVLKGHTDWVLDVALSASKKWILSSSKDSTLRLWSIENYEEIPAVIENKKAIGPRLSQCEECEKPFPVMHWDNANVITKCVFCRLSTPSNSVPSLPTVPQTLCAM